MRSPAKRAFPELSKMRDEGLIKGRAVGVNTPMAIHKVMDDADPDVCLCARRYSLIDHADRQSLHGFAREGCNAGFIGGSRRYK